MNELNNIDLDLAVARLEGWKYISIIQDPPQVMVSNKAGNYHHFNPSENWNQAGPIIFRERIQVKPNLTSSDWTSFYGRRDNLAVATGPTPQIAAMRCYVESMAQRQANQHPREVYHASPTLQSKSNS